MSIHLCVNSVYSSSHFPEPCPVLAESLASKVIQKRNHEANSCLDFLLVPFQSYHVFSHLILFPILEEINLFFSFSKPFAIFANDLFPFLPSLEIYFIHFPTLFLSSIDFFLPSYNSVEMFPLYKNLR